MYSHKLHRLLAVGAAAIVIGGGTYGIVSATASTGSSTTTTTSLTSAISAPHAFAGGRSNARSAPAAGGSSGVVTGASKSSFTILTSAGQKVAVKQTPSTKYETATRSSSASAVRKGVHVLVLGTTSGTTITATRVLVQPSGGRGSTSPSAGEVVPFKRGAASTGKTVGQIPTSYNQGSGTLASGTVANKATESALAAYPGGVVDRVVKLSDGDYEVHNIGVNWPHHIFVNRDFKVIGAE